MKREKVMGTKKWFYWVSIGIVLIIVYKFLDNFTGIGKWIGNLFTILVPFLVGILISYVLYIPSTKIEKFLKKNTKLKHTRGLSIAIVYFLAILLIAIIMKFIMPIIIESIIDLVNNIQNYYNTIASDEVNTEVSPWIHTNILKPIVEYVQKINFQEMFTPDKIKTYLDSAFGAVKSIVNIFISFICSIYILAQRESITKFIKDLAKSIMNRNGYKRFLRYFSNGNEIFFKFISSQVIDAFVVAAITSIAMSIMGVKYSLLLGVFIGISNLIPYFGAIVGVAISVIITLLTGGWKQALIMAIVVTILQQIDANVINPRITSSKLKISPLLVIFAVTIGGGYFGVLGMFIAVPIATLIKLIIEDFIQEKLKEKEQVEVIENNKEDINDNKLQN